ncbi:hypothetical protein [Paracidovorax citrulli]|uniref:deoxynucleotide monophosphate kinase family protein n=1 Tax=Paracidovorax citrulli TaxID=80869 RepID=UPI0005FBEF19|nr:hypothetical protein [Paracidovorax citrulli]
MTAPLILALTGRPDVGKDTIGDILAAQGFARFAFVDALRAEVAKAWRVDLRILTDRPTKETELPALAVGFCSEPGFMHWVAAGGESLTEPRSPRWVLQRWGTYQRRYVPGYYATIVERAIGRQLGSGWARMVVTDLRYPVEEAAMRRLGAVVVRVHRPDATPLAADTAADESERRAAAIEADTDIVNDGSLQALAESVHELVERLAVREVAA